MNQERTEESIKESSILIWLTGITFVAAMAAIFLFVPTEKTEGPIQRIMYLHNPSAWLSFFAFFNLLRFLRNSAKYPAIFSQNVVGSA